MILNLTKVSILGLAAMMYAGCGSTETQQPANNSPKKPIHKKIRPVGGGVKPPKPPKPAAREKDLAAQRALTSKFLQEASKEAVASAFPINFKFGLMHGEPAEEREGGQQFIVTGTSVSDGDLDVSNVVPGGWAGQSGMVIKYRSTCGVGDKVNPLVRNFVFMRAIKGIEAEVRKRSDEVALTPGPLVVSSQGKLPAKFARDFVKGLASPMDFSRCVEADYRFLIMEQVGVSLRKYFEDEKSVPLDNAILLMGNTINVLRVLHGFGVVHGDVHWGNALLLGASDGDGSVVLVDFDQSRFVDDAKLAGGPPSVSGKSAPEYLSPNELGGDAKYVPTYADDIYRAYEMVGALLRGPSFYDSLRSKQGSALGEAKKRSNWFVSAESRDLINKIPELNAAIQAFHATVHEGLKSPNAMPDHDKLLSLVTKMLTALEEE